MKRLSFFVIFTLSYIFIHAQSFSRYDLDTNVFSQKVTKQVSDTSFLITHSLSQEIIPETSVSCNNNRVQYLNSYYRAFDLGSSMFNINGDWSVQEVQIGIGYAKGGIDTLQQIQLILYVMSNYNGIIPLDSLSQKGDTIIFNVSDNESGTIKNIKVLPSISIPKSKVLVVEVLVPDGQEDGNIFFIGSNNLAQTDKTFIKAKHCDVSEPVDVAEIGYPDMHLLINVVGAYDAANPQILSFNIEGQLNETEILNDPNLISLILPADTSLNNLTPDVTIPAGFYVSPASGEIVDFSQGEVEYIVTNEYNKISESWLVNVAKAQAEILSFSITNQVGETIINKINHTVQIVMPSGTDLSNLTPNITLYRDFSISPSSGIAQDFSLGAVSYNVSHDKIDLSQDWSVTVTTETKYNKLSFINIYPNPATKKINIDTDNFIKVEIFNLSGIKLLNSNKKNIDISNLKKGYYFVKVYTVNDVLTKSFVVK